MGVPVFNPVRTALYGVLVAAVLIDSTFAFELKGRTNSDVVFLARDSLGAPHVAVSTLPPGSIDSAMSQIDLETAFGTTQQSSYVRMDVG